ncbi:MAG: histidinol dehydrogenase [Bacteroidales bacterium]|nr:histidinol dehydrogenase [Bacteroidales bacterium]
MQVIKYPKISNWAEILRRPQLETARLESLVSGILQQVKENGDKAVKEFSLKFDGTRLENLQVTEQEIIEAEKKVSKDLKEAIQLACSNIEKFHLSQKLEIKKIITTEGVVCWQKSVAIEKVGLYIPGGTAPLFSTVLMLAIPAKIAGCNEIVMCTPANNAGEIHPAILYSAQITGITKIFKIGGAQAIAAMAYGTESVPKVYKIFGPGNQYVMAAKQLVARQETGIDMPAGPSEVAVLADNTSNPVFIASDLLSQAEHGPDSQVLLITKDETIIEEVIREISTQLNELPRKEIAGQSLQNSKIILLKDDDTIMDLTNKYAPEHLIICTKNAEELAEKVINAGSVFIGDYTPESAGDYASGTNHTLPTHGYAKVFNGVNLDSFVKKISFQQINEKGLQNIGTAIMEMAQAESLDAHRKAVKLRLEFISEKEK